MSKLVFERGSPDRARGHALLYLRGAEDPDALRATYLLVLPVTLDIARYIPPMLASQLPLGDAQSTPAAMPLPPIPESIEGREWLERLADARDDDLICGGTAGATDIEAQMRLTSDAAQEYTRLYNEHIQSPTSSVLPGGTGPGTEVEDVLIGLMSDRDRLAEMVRLTGRTRDAVERGDRAQLAEAMADLKALARRFPEKYRLEGFLDAGWIPGDRGRQLAELYIDRCYRICNEDYAALEGIDRRIKALQS